MKKEMKQTEIGWIPENWEVKKLGDVGEVVAGLTYSPSDVSTSGTLVLRSSNIKDGRLDYNDNVYVKMELLDRVRVCANDILICARNGSRQLIGKCALITKDIEGEAFGAFMSIYRSSQNPFIFQAFSSSLIQRQIQNNLGATINQITNKDLKNFLIALPPPSEQQLITEALSDTDAWIEGLENMLHKKRLIKQGAMQVLLRPKDGWKVKKLGEVATLKARIGWQGLTTAEYKTSGEARLVTGTEFHAGTVHWDECHYVDFKRYQQDANIQLRQYDILVTKDGTIGKVAFIDEVEVPTTLNSGIFVIRPINNSFIPRFMSYILLSDVFKDFLSKLAAGSTISHLYQKDFVHFEFALPEIDEQINTSNVLSNIDAEISALETKLTKARRIKQGMMQQLLTGQIRLLNKTENSQAETLQRAIA